MTSGAGDVAGPPLGGGVGDGCAAGFGAPMRATLFRPLPTTAPALRPVASNESPRCCDAASRAPVSNAVLVFNPSDRQTRAMTNPSA